MENIPTLPDNADVYDVVGAFDAAQTAAPDDRTLLRQFTRRYPQFAEELIATGYVRFAFGWTLADPLEDEPEDPEIVALGRPVLQERLSPPSRPEHCPCSPNQPKRPGYRYCWDCLSIAGTDAHYREADYRE